MSRSTLRSVLVALLAAPFTGCATPQEASHVPGDCADAYGTEVCSWATMEAGQVVAIGATIPLASIEAAPLDAPMTWPPTMMAALDIPDAARPAGLTHLTMYWEPMGHMPATFMTPHFDFHFYLVPESRRLTIDCGNESKPTTLPAGYGMVDEVLPPEMVALTGEEVLVGVCVPQMGMHSLLMVQAESADLFDGTMIVGYYEGEPIFVEPMISQAFLSRRESFTLPVPAIPGRSGGPTAFQAVYDAETDAYRFELTGFSQRAQ